MGFLAPMPQHGVAASKQPRCAACGTPTRSFCQNCKAVNYCSQACQKRCWEDHKLLCGNGGGSSGNSSPEGKPGNQGGATGNGHVGREGGKECANGNGFRPPEKLLHPYNRFLALFNSEGFQGDPVGLVNTGNSCYANAVLQCLTFTPPFGALLLQQSHSQQCVESPCLYCDLTEHLETISAHAKALASGGGGGVRAKDRKVFSIKPLLAQAALPKARGYSFSDSQEDAHEFMRHILDRMLSIILQAYGGEKKVPHALQETTVVHHIFGGYLQSQVKCMECWSVSNTYECMLDLTLEVHAPEVDSLASALASFTAPEWMEGDNRYQCGSCKNYVRGRKQLTVFIPPNILTISLKRFQVGRFGKLNKQIAYPETLDLQPFISVGAPWPHLRHEYHLFALVVHLDMLNSSFFGHYVCYVLSSTNVWFRVDDTKVTPVQLSEVLKQKAYVLFYKRAEPRPSMEEAAPAARVPGGAPSTEPGKASRPVVPATGTSVPPQALPSGSPPTGQPEMSFRSAVSKPLAQVTVAPGVASSSVNGRGQEFLGGGGGGGGAPAGKENGHRLANGVAPAKRGGSAPPGSDGYAGHGGANGQGGESSHGNGVAYASSATGVVTAATPPSVLQATGQAHPSSSAPTAATSNGVMFHRPNGHGPAFTHAPVMASHAPVMASHGPTSTNAMPAAKGGTLLCTNGPLPPAGSAPGTNEASAIGGDAGQRANRHSVEPAKGARAPADPGPAEGLTGPGPASAVGSLLAANGGMIPSTVHGPGSSSPPGYFPPLAPGSGPPGSDPHLVTRVPSPPHPHLWTHQQQSDPGSFLPSHPGSSHSSSPESYSPPESTADGFDGYDAAEVELKLLHELHWGARQQQMLAAQQQYGQWRMAHLAQQLAMIQPAAVPAPPPGRATVAMHPPFSSSQMQYPVMAGPMVGQTVGQGYVHPWGMAGVMQPPLPPGMVPVAHGMPVPLMPMQPGRVPPFGGQYLPPVDLAASSPPSGHPGEPAMGAYQGHLAGYAGVVPVGPAPFGYVPVAVQHPGHAQGFVEAGWMVGDVASQQPLPPQHHEPMWWRQMQQQSQQQLQDQHQQQQQQQQQQSEAQQAAQGAFPGMQQELPPHPTWPEGYQQAQVAGQQQQQRQQQQQQQEQQLQQQAQMAAASCPPPQQPPRPAQHADGSWVTPTAPLDGHVHGASTPGWDVAGVSVTSPSPPSHHQVDKAVDVGDSDRLAGQADGSPAPMPAVANTRTLPGSGREAPLVVSGAENAGVGAQPMSGAAPPASAAEPLWEPHPSGRGARNKGSRVRQGGGDEKRGGAGARSPGEPEHESPPLSVPSLGTMRGAGPVPFSEGAAREPPPPPTLSATAAAEAARRLAPSGATMSSSTSVVEVHSDGPSFVLPGHGVKSQYQPPQQQQQPLPQQQQQQEPPVGEIKSSAREPPVATAEGAPQPGLAPVVPPGRRVTRSITAESRHMAEGGRPHTPSGTAPASQGDDDAQATNNNHGGGGVHLGQDAGHAGDGAVGGANSIAGVARSGGGCVDVSMQCDAGVKADAPLENGTVVDGPPVPPKGLCQVSWLPAQVTDATIREGEATVDAGAGPHATSGGGQHAMGRGKRRGASGAQGGGGNVCYYQLIDAGDGSVEESAGAQGAGPSGGQLELKLRSPHLVTFADIEEADLADAHRVVVVLTRGRGKLEVVVPVPVLGVASNAKFRRKDKILQLFFERAPPPASLTFPPQPVGDDPVRGTSGEELVASTMEKFGQLKTEDAPTQAVAANTGPGGKQGRQEGHPGKAAPKQN